MIKNNFKKRFLTSFILLSLVILIFNFNIILVYSLIILGVFSVLEFLELSNKIFTSKLILYLINFIFIFYIFIFCLLFFIFSSLMGFKIMLYILLLGCISSDIGGFTFGKIIGGPKLTKISPNKTYSGAIGSIILTLIVTSILFLYLIDIYDFKILIIAAITSVSCQFGDLLFSFLKRKAKIQDTGKILPGHGGVLDRLDGIFLGIPIGFLTLILLN